MAERIYTFEQVAEHLQGLVTVDKLKTLARRGQIETVIFGRKRGMNESQLNKLVRDGVPTPEQRRRAKRTPKPKPATVQRKPAPQALPPVDAASAPLEFDRSRSRRWRNGGAA